MKKIALLFVLALWLSFTGWSQSAPAALLLNENFEYTSGTAITANGWTAHSAGGTNAITVASSSITYSGYLSSGIGNEVTLATSGEDDNKSITSQNSGSVYASFLVNVTSSQTTGDYFAHFAQQSGSSGVTTFGGRVWIKKNSSGTNFAFGVSKSSTAANIAYTGFDYSLGITYLVVVKYTFVSGSNNDVGALYINPTLNAVEPTATLSTLTADNAAADLTQIASFCLRQGSASNAPALKLDGIRVATTWADIVGPAGIPSISANPTNLTGFTYTGSGPSSEQSFTVSGSFLSNDITITPPADYEISTGTGVSFVATNPITLTQSGGSVSSTTIYVRLKSGLSAGLYNNENIVAASSGATSQNISCSGYVYSNYYSAATGDLDQTSTWGTNTDGSGSHPSDFTGNCQIFNIRNNATPTIGAAWTVSGTSSKVILGDGTNTVNFTVPSAYAFTGTTDVSANATLTLQNAAIPTLGTISPSSTVIYGGDGSNPQNIIQATYGNLTLSGAGTKTFAANTTTVTGNLIFNSTTLSAPGSSPFATLSLGGDLTYMGTVNPPADANSVTLITTGTGTQTITGNGNLSRWFRLQTTSSGNIVDLSESGGPTNLSVGNASGGGVSLAAGSQLKLNGNTLTFFYGNNTILGTGTIYCTSAANIIINKNGNTAFGTLSLTPSPATLNDLVINMNGTGNTLTLGTSVIINDTLSLGSGTITPGANTITYGPSGILKYNSTGYATTSDLEFPAGNGPSSVFIKSAAPAGLSLHASRTLTGNLTIATGNKFIIPVSASLTVNDITNNAGAAGLVINSDATGTGSLIHGSSGDSATVKRYIPIWGDATHGWHLLSSPVAAQPIQTEFVPNPIGDQQDFYSWSELTNEWVNTKMVDGTWNPAFESNFIPGKGYLVAYGSNVTKSFTGVLNVTDVAKSSASAELSYTPSAYPGPVDPGWNLLGNPFCSALEWDTTAWMLSANIERTVKIWNESGASYTDIPQNGIIPAMQGFMVHVTDANTASLTIPAASRQHSSQAWYKESGTPRIKLAAHDPAGNTFQETVLMFDSRATSAYNISMDARFLPGYAPSFYSKKGSEELSTIVMPPIESSTTIPLGFVKTASADYTIEATEIENISAQVLLTDLKLNITQNLKENPVYSFTSSGGDDPARFLISFGHVGLGEKNPDNGGIYTFGNSLYLVNPGQARLEIFSLTGQKMLTEQVNSPGLYRTTVSFPTGYYVVRLTAGTKVMVKKVMIRS